MRVFAIGKNNYTNNDLKQSSKTVSSLSFCSNNVASELPEIANRLFMIGQQELGSFLPIMKGIADGLPLLYRVKKPYSIASKIERTGLPQICSFAEYQKAANDLLGATIITDGDATTGKVVDNLAAAVRSKKIKFVRIKNTTQSNLPYYLSPEDISKLQQVHNVLSLEQIKVVHDSGLKREDGYIGTNILGQTASGCFFELQIKDANVRNIDIGFHIPWSILSNRKVIIPSNEAASQILKPLEAACLSLTPAQVDDYNGYQRAAYKAARENGLGLKSEYPQLPLSLPRILDYKNVLRIHGLVIG